MVESNDIKNRSALKRLVRFILTFFLYIRKLFVYLLLVIHVGDIYYYEL